MATDTPERNATAGERELDNPTDLSKRAWLGVLKRTVKEFREDDLTDWAAALTYYGILALFPALLVVVSLLGLSGSGTTEALIDNLEAAAPGPAKDILVPAITNLEADRGAAGLLFFVGLGVALWSASAYIGAFTRASNAIYEVEEGRPFYKLKPLQLLITLAMVVLLGISAAAVVVTGGLAEEVGKLIGVGDTAVQVWDIVKWPVIVLMVSFMFSVLYWSAPNVEHPRFPWLTPGGVLAVVLWIVASAGFAFYVGNFANYNKTYGTLGAAIIFLVWLWITNVAVLLGAELNAELARGKRHAEGQPLDQEPILPPRDTTKLEQSPETG